MGLAKCAGTKISYNGTLPQSPSRYLRFLYSKTKLFLAANEIKSVLHITILNSLFLS